ncbi:hypothetical protein [Bacillus sp. C1]
MGETKERNERVYMCLYGANLSKKIYTTLFCTFQHPVSVLSRIFQGIGNNGKKRGDTEKQRRLRF